MTRPMTLDRLSPEVRAKLARIQARQANRDRLKRIREALARIQAEIAAALDRKRQASASDREYLEDQLLRRIKSVRADVNMLET
jgi:hypothetical protein